MYAMRPRDLNALSALVTYEMQRNARGNYVADMLWLIAGGSNVAAEVFTLLRMDGLAQGSWMALAARGPGGFGERRRGRGGGLGGAPRRLARPQTKRKG